MTTDRLRGNASRKVALAACIAALAGCAIPTRTGASPSTATVATLRGAWASVPVVVDGSGTSDWAESTMAPLAGLQLSTAVQRDERFLYLLFLTRDPRQAQLLLTGDFTVWLDARGEGAKRVELAIGPAMTRESVGAEASVATAGALTGGDSQAVALDVTLRRSGEPQGASPDAGASPVVAARGLDNEWSCYEIAVPLASLGVPLGPVLSLGVRVLVPPPLPNDAEPPSPERRKEPPVTSRESWIGIGLDDGLSFGR